MYTYEIVSDEYPFNPRTEWDHVSTMVCFHRRYDLGDDDHGYSFGDYSSWDELKSQLIKDGARAILPVYMLDHGQLAISTKDFRDPWDSGQIGFIFMTAEEIRTNFMVKRVTEKVVERAYELLDAEVKEYNAYLSGDVWGFVIKDHNGDEVESCWGFYGYDWCQKEAEFTLEGWNALEKAEKYVS